ncbi:MAG: hypothetical protein RBJ76_01885 [Stenomitos frigidus ULC029]
MNRQSQWLFEAPPASLSNDVSSFPSLEFEQNWLFEAPVQKAPTLIGSESTPPSSTLYIKSNIGCTTKRDKTKVCPQPMTGIFLSENYRFTPQADLILYLQGHHRTNLTINQYWNQRYYPFFAFREGVNASGKNVILVAPTLGSKSEAGNLIQSNGFDAYIDQVLAAIRTYFAPSMMFDQPLSLGNLILACHSGGGLPMREIALSRTKYASKIRECWGFDCIYNSGDADFWKKWATGNSSRKVYIYYISTCLAQDPTIPMKDSITQKVQWKSAACPSSFSGCDNRKPPKVGGKQCTNTTFEAMKLASLKLPNVCVFDTTKVKDLKQRTTNHNHVPITYWKARIKAAPFLADR